MEAGLESQGDPVCRCRASRTQNLPLLGPLPGLRLCRAACSSLTGDVWLSFSDAAHLVLKARNKEKVEDAALPLTPATPGPWKKGLGRLCLRPSSFPYSRADRSNPRPYFLPGPKTLQPSSTSIPAWLPCPCLRQPGGRTSSLQGPVQGPQATASQAPRTCPR